MENKLSDEAREGAGFVVFIVVILAIGISLIIGVILLFARINLITSAWHGEAQLKEADWNRQITVREAQAKMDSSKLLAEAEVERAKGVAQANKIIGDSLKDNESYLRYLWIDSLQHTQDKIIYVPTEAGLPILEANRLK